MGLDLYECNRTRGRQVPSRSRLSEGSEWPIIKGLTDRDTMDRNAPEACTQCPTRSKASFMATMLVQRLKMQSE